MDWSITLVVTAVLAALAGLFGWAGSRPPDPRRGPRLAPYRFLMLLCAFGVMLTLAHMLTLAGVKTGH